MKIKYFLIVLFITINNTLYSQEYPITITEEGHIFIEVTLNKNTKANFILDTGAGAIILSQKTFNKIKDSAKKAGFFKGFRFDGDRIDSELYKISSLSVGNEKLTDVITGVYPPLDQYGVDGLLSLKFFENKPFTIDFKNKTISFLTRKQVKVLAKQNTNIPIMLEIHRNISLDMFIPLQINNKVLVNALLDTGSGFGALFVNQEFIKPLSLNPKEGKEAIYTNPISGKKLKDCVFPVESVKLLNTNIKTKNTYNKIIFREGIIYEALIGSKLFKDAKITIEIQNKNMIVQEK
tara:strand:+ start:14196 stop:15074 length:879 start_codon:yes stop_codon:yes gene_type:complete